MKNIALVFDSTYMIGGGHFWRCYNLARILRKSNKNFIFISNSLKKEFINLLKESKFKYLKLNNLKNINKLEFIIKKFKIDILVTDYYEFSYKDKKRLKNSVDKLIVIDDYVNKKHFCDIYINNNFMSMQTKSKIKMLNPEAQLLLGPKYVINEKIIKKKNKFKKKSNSFFVFFGSSDPSNLTLKFLRWVSDLNEIKFNVLIGKLNRNYKKIKFFCKDKKNIKIFYDLSNNNVLNLISKNKYSLGSGGINLTERLIYGLPSIVICTATNQKEALKELKKKKIIYYLGSYKYLNKKIILRGIKNIIENKLLVKLMKKNIDLYYNLERNSNPLIKNLDKVIYS